MTVGKLTINELDILETDNDPSVVGLSAPIGSLAILDGAARKWQKFGANDTDWKEDASPLIKSGVVAFGSFAGNPKKATVTFTTAFPDTNYSITITPGEARIATFENKLATGFTINLNANQTPTAAVQWQAIYIGETGG